MGDLPAVAFGEGWVLPMSGGLTQTHGQDQPSPGRYGRQVARASADIQTSHRQYGDAPSRKPATPLRG